MAKTILLISYVFPPYPGIGGRRWAKFAKYLANAGHTVHVISARNPFQETSAWMGDVDNNARIQITYLPAAYPKALLRKPLSICEKFAYHLWLCALRILTRGYVYERSIFWRKPLMREAARLIAEHGIDNIIATGAPFHLLHHCLDLKTRFPRLNLICDFRDRWTDSDSFFHYQHLGPKRLAYEVALEADVISKSDHVVTVADRMTQDLKKRAPAGKTRFVTIPNGFDPDDFVGIQPAARQDRKIRFAYIGNLYNELDYVFYPFLETLTAWKEAKPDLYSRLEFNFWGNHPEKYAAAVRSKNLDCVHFHGYIPLREAMQNVADADFGMLFITSDHSFMTGSKFAEYLALRKPVVMFAKRDESMEFITRNRFGYGCEPKTLEADLARVAADFDEGHSTFNPSFDVSQFSILRLTQQLEALLI